MRVEEFKNIKEQKISKAICSNYFNVSYNLVQKLLNQKDVKVNGKRVSKDITIKENDLITFYFPENKNSLVEIIYQDDNIVVVFKPRKIETVSQTDEIDLLKIVSSQLCIECFAVHRLDRNTEGLVVFAKNEQAKQSLDLSFKNRTIDKFYMALVFGNFEKKSDVLTAYLKKNSNKSLVEISDEKKLGFEKIKTGYKVLKEIDDLTLIEVELFTGKTHQIRAHFAHIGNFVIGDEKYGNTNINKKYKCRYQNLCAYKIKFHFKNNDPLFYLNEKEICLDNSKIDFCQNL